MPEHLRSVEIMTIRAHLKKLKIMITKQVWRKQRLIRWLAKYKERYMDEWMRQKMEHIRPLMLSELELHREQPKHRLVHKM
jgi:hypothetical protein